MYDVAFWSIYIYIKLFPRDHYGFCTDLAGSNNLEMAKAESVLETIVEIQDDVMNRLFSEKDEAKKVCRQVKRSPLKDLSRFLVCSYLPFLNIARCFNCH